VYKSSTSSAEHNVNFYNYLFIYMYQWWRCISTFLYYLLQRQRYLQ